MKINSKTTIFLLLSFIVVLVVIGSLGSIYSLLTSSRSAISTEKVSNSSFSNKEIIVVKNNLDEDINYNFSVY